MVVEAGGCICDLAGGVWGVDSAGCIASNGMLHDSLLELVLEG
jgi:fructose-1,6-bisphosphatase/inositol monophosphatase family enzyme